MPSHGLWGGVRRTLVFRGSAYGTAVQAASALTNVALTPYIIVRLGVPAFGVVVVATAYLAFLSVANNGLLTATARYAAVSQADPDRTAMPRFFASALLSVLALSLLFAGLVYGLAPLLLSVVDAPAQLTTDGVFLLRVLGALAILSLPAGLLTAVLSAQGRFRATALSAVAGQAAYVGVMVYALQVTPTLRSYALALVARQAVVLLCVLWPSRATLGRATLRRRMASAQLRGYLRFAGQLTFVQVLGSVDQSADAVVIGSFVGTRATAQYGAGNTLATQLRSLPLNALGPVAISLSRAYGSGGLASLRQKYEQLERLWVVAVAGYSAAVIGSAYFGVLAWLGPEFRDAAVYAALLAAADTVNLWTGVLTAYLGALGRSDIEVRYGLLSGLVNVALTLPLVVFGPLGVVLGTVAGEVVGSLLLVRIARRRLGAGAVQNFLRWVPVVPFLLTIALVFALEWALSGALPQGPVGLLACAGPACVGLLLYAALIRPRRLLAQMGSL